MPIQFLINQLCQIQEASPQIRRVFPGHEGASDRFLFIFRQSVNLAVQAAFQPVTVSQQIDVQFPDVFQLADRTEQVAPVDRHRGVHQADPDRFAGGGNILFLFVAVP